MNRYTSYINNGHSIYRNPNEDIGKIDINNKPDTN